MPFVQWSSFSRWIASDADAGPILDADVARINDADGQQHQHDVAERFECCMHDRPLEVNGICLRWRRDCPARNRNACWPTRAAPSVRQRTDGPGRAMESSLGEMTRAPGAEAAWPPCACCWTRISGCRAVPNQRASRERSSPLMPTRAKVAASVPLVTPGVSGKEASARAVVVRVVTTR